ncbi:hypothetical protein FSB78_01530 [Sphingomonas ginsenosidivorax]|uniref:Uncharacterized protein n=1 Tax=Sphingomonas ginsenosidivorax TaxID=862135 RepID=A0A5C6UAG2_9SPHN|nr:hypothetical protein [Sphingomonas ginsenosidivorax]TXC69782.1 hypothetical protein FSB78_01530 [Sphingomonas ginsenosidivorax]
MAFSIMVPGVSARGSGLPIVGQYLDGMGTFPARNLLALYLLQDGAIGEAFAGPLADRGLFGRHGTLIAGSMPKRTAAGMDSYGAGDKGWMVDTNVPMDGSFTIGIVAKSSQVQPASGFPTFWGPRAHIASVPLLDGGVTTGPILDFGVQAADKFNAALYRAGGWAPDAGVLKDLLHPVASTTRTATGVSYKAETGRWVMANATHSTEWTDKPAGDALIALGTTHAFGATRFYDGTPSGELNLAVVYRRAKTADEMQPMLAAMRATVAARGVQVA